ncbi:MAG: DNA recombination protein RmuC, partial [Betaproteobacteria bacterium]|nr:DNA recombination protein RmuC [Betaproteobacteria bacterium]
MMSDWSYVIVLAVIIGAALYVMRRFTQAPSQANQAMEQLEEKLERISRDMRFEVSENLRGNRQEMSQSMAQFQQTLTEQLSLMQANLNTQLQSLSEGNTRRMAEVRETLDKQLTNLQQTNTAKLDEMRKTVDEKLQTTLEARLNESFKLVADRLDQVHQGLGQMQTLAQGVGDLQRVLSNVKTRGIFGEVQLQALLDQVLTIEQYGKQVETRPRSNQFVDFAIKLPGRSEDGLPVWLPIDAKFPREDYERLLEAQNRSDAPGAESAAKAMEARIRLEAKTIADSYLSPPHTTDFAILFLP